VGPRCDALLVVGACGGAADAIYHQLAYEMVRPGVDQAVTAFLFGCVALSIAPAKAKIVAKWNPLLYAVALGVALLG
jgi:hypothetical protein